MKKSRLSRKKKKVRKGKRMPDAPPAVPADPRTMEKLTYDITKLLDQQDFQSVDEINAFMEELMKAGPVPSYEPQTEKEKAQAIMYEAWEEDERQGSALARKALKVDRDCVDAYVLLAERGSKDIVEARDLLRKGVEAGERSLGKEFFAENEGQFWGIIGTRPYMRALQGLAEHQWMLGYRDEAIAMAQTMLRLNPNDNQGIRYSLVLWLFSTQRFDELESLIHQFEEDVSVNMGYTVALYTFYKEGDSAKSRSALKSAKRWNKHVPDFLLIRRDAPVIASEYMTMGGEEEAMMYVIMARLAWQSVPGALEWLAKRTR